MKEECFHIGFPIKGPFQFHRGPNIICSRCIHGITFMLEPKVFDEKLYGREKEYESHVIEMKKEWDRYYPNNDKGQMGLIAEWERFVNNLPG